MPETDFNASAQALRGLLKADAVLYWYQDNPTLALPLGMAPAGLLAGGFRAPEFGGGIHLEQGESAFALIPLRMRKGMKVGKCVVLAGKDAERGGIMAVWHGPGAYPPDQARTLMEFALAALRPPLDFARAHAELQQSAARRMSGMADALPQGVIIVPSRNRPGYLNHAAAAWLDLAQGEVEPSLLAEKLAALARRAGDHDEAIRAQVEAFVAGHGGFPLSGRVWRFTDRNPKALRVTVSPVGPAHADGWFWLLEDVSAAEAEAEAREQQRRLKWLNAELERRVDERTKQAEHANEILLQTNIELQHFAHAMAHDLQNPLRSIAGFTQLMQKAVSKYGDADVDAWAAQVVNSTRRLQDLIQSLLAYTRLDAQAVRAEPVDMNVLFDEVKTSLQAMIDETRAEVGREPLPNVKCVRTQIGQVLQNLIENGIKYNTNTPPRVRVSCRRQDESWIFSVSDNGMGIEPRYHEQIFAMFRRLHAYSQIPGTGIGLALCHRIIERHGGRIWVESQVEEGATFYFTLPVERLTADVRPATADV